MIIIQWLLIALIIMILSYAFTVCYMVGKSYEYEIPESEIVNTNTNTNAFGGAE